MYNIYQTHGEEMTEDTKIRFLFKKIDYQGLSNTVEAMKTKIATEVPGTVTYTTVANHLSTAVSELPPTVLDKAGIVVVFNVAQVPIMVSSMKMAQSILDITRPGQMEWIQGTISR